ncbi:hypothetical protein LXL04_013114 [Taraxacum kok-saghyz]
MSVSISTNANEKKCHLVDFEGRKFEIMLPHYVAGRICIGVTCGYLIWCSENTGDFWLVNPITRHELHFPFPDIDFQSLPRRLLGAILMFSHSLSGWVFIMFNRHCDKIWFCTIGKQEWTCVSTIFPVYHLQAFKGKIYTLYSDNRIGEVTLCLTTPKVTLLEFKNIPEPRFTYPRFVSSGENLYAMDLSLRYPYQNIHEINLGKREWVSRKKTGEENGFFLSCLYYGAAVIRAEIWADLQSKYGRYARACDTGKVCTFGLIRVIREEDDISTRGGVFKPVPCTGMAKRKSMTRNQNHDDASSKKKLKPCVFCVRMAKTRSMTRMRNHNDASSKKRMKTWSDLNHDVLNLVMMKLGVIDYVAFSRVLTCGYMILCTEKSRDFWLVNPITRHELHFPFPFPDIDFELLQLGLLGAVLM